MQGNDTHPWQSGNTSTVGYSQSPEVSNLCEQMAWRGCLCGCLQHQLSLGCAIQLLKILLNFCPPAVLQDWTQRVDLISSLNFLFLCIRNSPAVITLVWNSAERKKRPMCLLFSPIFDSWDLSGTFKFCATIMSLRKFSCQSKLSCICCKLLRPVAA